MSLPYRVTHFLNRFRNTTSAAFFEAKYKEKADPWGFEYKPYELARYDTILAALAPHRYQRAFEPGCSVGVLTARLAAICDAVEACDFSPTAIEQAKQRCAAFPHVHITLEALTGHSAAAMMATGPFDLIVLSEIGYYFKIPDLRTLISNLLTPLPQGATLLASHWLGTTEDHILSGDQVHAIIAESPLLRHEHAERHEIFRLDRWRRV